MGMARAARVRAVLLDLGDTIMREESEEKDTGGVTQRADLFPGAAATLHALHTAGYPLALVADTRTGTAMNVLGQHGVLGCFAALAISEQVGCEKPDRRIFAAALTALGVLPGEWARVLMVGNNLSRDVRGANALGLIAVWMHANARYPLVPATPEETPRHEITDLRDLPALIARIEGGGNV